LKDLLAPHRKLLREDEVKVKADSNQTVRGKTLQLLLFNDMIVACPQSKLGILRFPPLLVP